jgi:hypothetical protein
MRRLALALLLVLVTVLVLSACGGSGGSGTTSTASKLTPAQLKAQRALRVKEARKYIKTATDLENYKRGYFACRALGVDNLKKQRNLDSDDPELLAKDFAKDWLPNFREPTRIGCRDALKKWQPLVSVPKELAPTNSQSTS